MTIPELFLGLLLALVAAMYLRRYLRHRSVNHYSPQEVRDLLSGRQPIVLLDVRTPAEHREQHIKGSVHIPLHELTRRLEELRQHEGSEIVCYCQTGSRSMEAAIRLQKAGFSVANMKGGIAEWKFSNLGR